MSTQVSRVQSKHFRLKQLANGVYTAIHRDGGCLICNAGIVDLGNQTMVFDTGLTPQAARDLQVAAKALTGRTPDYVVNSHYHNDHIRGNQVFTKAIVVSTSRTRELIATKGHEELESDRKQAPESLATMKTWVKSKDAKKREEASIWLPYWQGILASLPKIRLCLPDLTFKDQLTFYGTRRIAHLIAVGSGHTESDCVLFLPQEKIVFCSDLLFVGFHPYLGDGDAEALLSVSDKLKKLEAKIYVPGHGKVGMKEDLDKMQLYVRTLMQQVQEAVAEGKTVEDVVKQPIPKPFAQWIFAMFYESNLRFLYDRLVKD